MGFRALSGLARRIVLSGGLLAAGFLGLSRQAHAEYTLSLSQFNFGSQPVGLQSNVLGTLVTNVGKSAITVSKMSVTGAGFYLTVGVTPQTIGPGLRFLYEVYFLPTAAQSYSGKLILVIDGGQAVIPLQGTGVATSAKVSVTPSHISFGNHPLGNVSAAQTFTIKNTGTSKLAVESVTTNPPFTIGGFQAATLAPGQSTSANVTYFANAAGGTPGMVLVTYDVLPASGISLQGAATAATSFGIITYPALPPGTGGAPYLASLHSAGATGAVTWSVVQGTGTRTLPPGLELSSSGTISGTIPASAAAQSYSPTVQATDSATPRHTAEMNMAIMVKKTTGANCSNITFDVPGTSQQLIGIHDLGTATYVGVEGGLYPNGSNTRPPAHNADGVGLAKSIQPLDANGNPSPNGKYVFMAVGVSTAKDTWAGFENLANADPDKNSKLVLVNGAEPSGTAEKFADSSNPFWPTVFDFLLPNSGVTANQVVAVWYQDLFSDPHGTFPSDMAGLQRAIEDTAQNLHTFFPNLKLMYLTPWPYGGYCNGYQSIIFEPYAYEGGFAVKDAIGDQLSGLPALNYDPSKGPVNAPWMDWGPYLWSNGMRADNNGFATTCQDFKTQDCRHPGPVIGQPKWGGIMLKYFKSDPTSAPWFLSPAARAQK